MNVIDVADLKDQLGKLIDWLEAGEIVHITRDDKPFACATPISLISSSEHVNASASDLFADTRLEGAPVSCDPARPIRK
jgi:antitoxin (DNA-binding transcriptional repressor) of toxin-antitoxin stability system